ncbi:MFS transporter [Puniceibacterium sediminis]|uniref:Major Facilitator Superfamily protein n=1 Tax=Puniceibacterium sediminis TaxID=1608407 RepID=A0A238WNW3_9RHOB|nr:MFS transporter [Puniceibacterium sediminis]SNR48215.1 Major Facilitator Superfamily protein [Puniceibacterium sediminis]
MLERRIPEWLRHAPAPSIRGFATLAACEAAARGMLISVFPVALYNALQDAALVSRIYFLIGLASLCTGLLVPWINRHMPRRWIYGLGASLFTIGTACALTGSAAGVIAALACTTLSTVITFVCFNAYVLDYIDKIELGACETQRLFYSALGWTIGPVAGVTLMTLWPPAPFLISGAASIAMLITFLIMRLGNGKLLTRARRAAPNPLTYLGRFFAQPRLVAGWLFAVIRSCGWWAYVIYLPIYALHAGLPDTVGGTMLSLTNATLFLTPLMLRLMRRLSIRGTVRLGFAGATLAFTAAAILSPWPIAATSALYAGSVCLILLDVSAGLPFLMAVKPSERTEMSAVYSSYRDVSGIFTPGAAWLVLLVAPVWGIFAATAGALGLAWGIAASLHPRLGTQRIRLTPAE